MPSRIEIELTSARPDGTWTWRAAGALRPRGVLDGSVLFEGVKVGDVLRADAEFELDGITIVSVSPPRQERKPEPERIELLGPGPKAPGATAGEGARRPPRHPRAGRRPQGAEDRPHAPRGRRRGLEGASAAGDGERSFARSPGRGDRRAEDGAGRAGPGSGATPDKEVGRDGEDARREPPGRRSAAQRREAPRPRAARSKRLVVGDEHRRAVLDSLEPVERPVAEQVLRGGIPAVRTAIRLEQERAAADGRPAPDAQGLIDIAERLLPRLKAAEWLDRAEAVARAPEEAPLRDLRSVVAGSEAARDPASRALAETLRTALAQRLAKMESDWTAEIARYLDANRLLKALRLSSRPPDPSLRLPAELAARLADAASHAMAPATPVEQWRALLEAVVASPVRRAVKPEGLPEGGGEEVQREALQAAGRVPALAGLLGLPLPPPPGPVRPRRAEAPGAARRS